MSAIQALKTDTPTKITSETSFRSYIGRISGVYMSSLSCEGCFGGKGEAGVCFAVLDECPLEKDLKPRGRLLRGGRCI
jgi:hypothetical protein